MPATLHVHVPLHCYCSPHTDPTLLHTSIKQQETGTFIYHATAICINKKNIHQMPHMSHVKITQCLGTIQWGKYANIYAKLELAAMSNAYTDTGQISQKQ